jgi:hypothetical protein
LGNSQKNKNFKSIFDVLFTHFDCLLLYHDVGSVRV